MYCVRFGLTKVTGDERSRVYVDTAVLLGGILPYTAIDVPVYVQRDANKCIS